MRISFLYDENLPSRKSAMIQILNTAYELAALDVRVAQGLLEVRRVREVEVEKRDLAVDEATPDHVAAFGPVEIVVKG